MFETSKDFFNIIFGISIFVVAAFLSYLFYQMATMIRNVNRTMSRIHNLIDGINQLVKKLKDKADSAGAYIAILAKSAQQVFEFINKNKKTSTGRKSATEK